MADIDTSKALYCSLVRSVLEYCSPLWCPDTKVAMKCIEDVQDRFVRLLFFKHNGFYPNAISCESLLEHLGLRSLRERRCEADLKFLYKLVNYIIADSGLLVALNFRVPNVRLRIIDRSVFLPSGDTGTLPRIQMLFNDFPDLDLSFPLITFLKQYESLLG